MSIWDKAWNWNATDEEWRETHPCDKHIAVPYRVLMRAIDVEAPASVMYRWICQLKLAPYSYDLIDNWGRQSPRQLTPGAERMELGQQFGIGRIVDLEEDRQVTVVVDGASARFFGFFSLTYSVKPTGPASCRVVVKADMACQRWWERARLRVLVWGDLIMMRKQLITLKSLAEKTVREEQLTEGA